MCGHPTSTGVDNDSDIIVQTTRIPKRGFETAPFRNTSAVGYSNCPHLVDLLTDARPLMHRSSVHSNPLPYLASLQVVIVGAGSIMSGVMDNLTALMHRTVFMPCPMGDLPFTKRFYDAILHGAIPVVFQRPFADPGFRGQRGMAWWYRKGEVDNMRKQGLEPPTEPFIVPDIGVPLDEYVVRLPRHSLGGRPQTQGFIHQLSRIPEAVIRRKLRRVAEVRNLFLYDYKGSGPDAVSVLLRSIYKRVVLGRKSARRKQD